MADEGGVWKPGSFTKNFSWGEETAGLSELHSVIRMGFDNRLEDVERDVFRERVRGSGRPDFIPMNFFLFNRVVHGRNMICVDELVFQALRWEHGDAFDRLALFTFIFSFVGSWNGAKPEQRRPAMWANAYVRERVAKDLRWNEAEITADDIERFVRDDSRYTAKTSRKLATNLNYLLHQGHIGAFADAKVSSWWVDCVFLALDRLIEDGLINGQRFQPSQFGGLLNQSGFYVLTGGATSEKTMAAKHLINLYLMLAGRLRFDQGEMVDRVLGTLGIEAARANDDTPRGAVHRTNPRIVKSIPPMCADLARQAGFDVLTAGELTEFDVPSHVSKVTDQGLSALRNRGIASKMSLDEFLNLTRNS